MAAPNQQQLTGAYVQQSPLFDVQRLYQVDVKSPEFKELIVQLGQQINNISISMQNREFSNYLLEMLVDGQNWFNPTPAANTQLGLRPNFRQVYNTFTTINHGLSITSTWKFTRIWGVFTDNVGNNYYPVPWASAAGATNIEIKVNATQIVITDNSGIAWTSGLVVLEWLMQ